MAFDGNPDLDALGRFVRERRATLGLTQAQLAERVGWVQERVSVIENGKYGMPSLPALIRLTESLEVPFRGLLEAAGYRDSAATLPTVESSALQHTLVYALQRMLAIDATTLRETLDEASDLLAQTMGSDKIDAFLLDATTESLVALGTSNTPMGRRQHALGLDREPLANGGRTVEVFRTGETFYTPHADHDPGMTRGTVQALGVRSFLSVPLRLDGVIIGVLVADSAYPDRFSHDERQFFDAAAQWVSLIAKRAKLTEALNRIALENARGLAAGEMVIVDVHELESAISPVRGCLDTLSRRFSLEGREKDLNDVTEGLRGMERLQHVLADPDKAARLVPGSSVPA